jgi:hypothetical protein
MSVFSMFSRRGIAVANDPQLIVRIFHLPVSRDPSALNWR